jgi:hypothetical protein
MPLTEGLQPKQDPEEVDLKMELLIFMSLLPSLHLS